MKSSQDQSRTYFRILVPMPLPLPRMREQIYRIAASGEHCVPVDRNSLGEQSAQSPEDRLDSPGVASQRWPDIDTGLLGARALHQRRLEDRVRTDFQKHRLGLVH